jgi:hypothetical protein
LAMVSDSIKFLKSRGLPSSLMPSTSLMV